MRSRAAAAPAKLARRAAAGRAHLLAGLLVACVAAGGGWLTVFAWRHRVASSLRDRSPFALEDTVWRTVKAAARVSGRRCPPNVPVAVLYVSRSCVHCEAELARWGQLVRDGAPEVACVAIAVVAPYAKSSPAGVWLPPELSNRLKWDRDGAIGRAVDARLVPVVVFVTSTGVVRARTVGESSEAATLERLRTLRSLSTIESGGH